MGFTSFRIYIFSGICLLFLGGVLIWTDFQEPNVSRFRTLLGLDGGSGREVACTMEAKLCPDGSAVGRTGPNCEFAPCPAVNEDQGKIDVSDWKIYRNEKYGFEVKYPPDWVIEAAPASQLVTGLRVSLGFYQEDMEDAVRPELSINVLDGPFESEIELIRSIMTEITRETKTFYGSQQWVLLEFKEEQFGSTIFTALLTHNDMTFQINADKKDFIAKILPSFKLLP